MNKFILLLSVLAIISCRLTAEEEEYAFKTFQKFVNKYNKRYDSIEEFLARYRIYKYNLVNSLMETRERKLYKTGITKFSDMTQQEFAKIYLNLDYTALATINRRPVKPSNSNAAPDSYDWRDTVRVGPVKDQASCGSCWAFSTIANLEGLYAEKKNTYLALSEQLLVDCDTEDSGCNGGLMEYAFTWLESNGLETESDYAYSGTKGTCKKDTSKYIDMKVTGYKQLSDWSAGDETEIKEFLYETGPLSVALNANPLQTYVSGILDLTSSQCSPSGLNHAVTLVGYGTESGTDYWIVRNSWGSSWGEKGYFRIARGKSTCGINYYVITATVSF